jgi:hypothetical protein
MVVPDFSCASYIVKRASLYNFQGSRDRKIIVRVPRRSQNSEDIERLRLRVRTTVVHNAATTTVARLVGCYRWRKPTAAEGAAGAIDLYEEHHDIVRISAGTVERFNQGCQPGIPACR